MLISPYAPHKSLSFFQSLRVGNNGRRDLLLLRYSKALLIIHVPEEACYDADCLGLSYRVIRRLREYETTFFSLSDILVYFQVPSTVVFPTIVQKFSQFGKSWDTFKVE